MLPHGAAVEASIGDAVRRATKPEGLARDSLGEPRRLAGRGPSLLPDRRLRGNIARDGSELTNNVGSGMRENVDRPLRPMVEASPEACAEGRRALDIAIATFRKWDVVMPSGSWVHDAASWLDRAVLRNSLGERQEEREHIAAASALAVDLYHISTCLGGESNPQVAAELALLARGKLLGRGDSAAGRDFLSQFWVGALLAQSTLQPHVIAHDSPGRPKPDYLITFSETRFAIEVKRPRSTSSAARAVLKAAAQLRAFGGPGIIVIDATECMSIGPFQVIRRGDNARALVRAELLALHGSLFELAASYRRSGKFSHLAMLVTMARYWNWEVDDAGSQRRDAGLLFNAYAFPYIWSRQVTQLTGDIQRALLLGVERLTGNPPSYTSS